MCIHKIPGLQIDYNRHKAFKISNIQLCKSTALSFDGLFANEINHYVDCIINGTPCKSPAEDGVTLMKILDAIYKSAETGHEVILED